MCIKASALLLSLVPKCIGGLRRGLVVGNMWLLVGTPSLAAYGARPLEISRNVVSERPQTWTGR